MADEERREERFRRHAAGEHLPAKRAKAASPDKLMEAEVGAFLTFCLPVCRALSPSLTRPFSHYSPTLLPKIFWQYGM